MKRRLLLLISLLGLTSGFTWLARPAPDDTELGDTITLKTGESGCYHGDATELHWKRQGRLFVSQEGRHNLTLDEVRNLRHILLQAPTGQADPAALGITPETVRGHRAEILRAAGVDHVPPAAESELGYSRVAARAVGFATGGSGTEAARFELRMTGLVATAQGWPRYYMLPWTIKTSGGTLKSCSVKIPVAIGSWLAPQDAAAHLLDGSRYWPDKFWQDDMAWSELGDTVNELDSRERASALAGFDKLEFHVEVALTGCINLAPESLFVQLQSRSPRPLDAAWWWSPMKGGKPSCDWNDFRDIHQRAENALQAHHWLLEWKAAKPGRSLELCAVGRQGYQEDQPQYFLFPPWHDAGLPGRPEFEIRARNGKEARGTILLSSTCPNAVITSTQEGPGHSGPHWFDKMQVFYHPTQPDYILVDPEGRPHRQRGQRRLLLNHFQNHPKKSVKL